MEFNTFIKAVGTGPKGNRDLSFDETFKMMEMILKSEVSAELITAFLLGWRLKPETSEEFCGALSAIDSLSTATQVANSIELGYPFDGKAKNPYLLLDIAKYLKNTPLHLVVAGDKRQPAKDGLTTKELLQDKSINNLHFFDRKEYCPTLSKLTDLRMQLGLRTALNTIEKLPNISGSSFAITGVHHKPYVQKYMDIFASRYEKFAVIQGNEGSPELFKKGKLWLIQNGITQEYLIDPLAFDIQESDDFEGLAKLNAAILLFVADIYPSIELAFEDLYL